MTVLRQKQTGVQMQSEQKRIGAPKITGLRQIWIPIVKGDVLVRADGRLYVFEEEVGTAEAARVLHCSIRHVQAMCDEGRLVEGRDWRKLPGKARGFREYRIRRRALVELRLKAKS